MLQIICHYTFFSNEVNPISTILMLLTMGIFGLFAIRIWIGNRIDDIKTKARLKERNSKLIEEAKEILEHDRKNNEKIRQVRSSINHTDWFFKGYISGATNGNDYGASFLRVSTSEITVQEWEKYQSGMMSHIKEDSDYFGGNKEMALYAYFEGHKYGLKRYCEKGPAN